jgi:hypothetical protein
MMGMGYAQNMYSDLQEILKYCTVSSRNFLKLHAQSLSVELEENYHIVVRFQNISTYETT